MFVEIKRSGREDKFMVWETFDKKLYQVFVTRSKNSKNVFNNYLEFLSLFCNSVKLGCWFSKFVKIGQLRDL